MITLAMMMYRQAVQKMLNQCPNVTFFFFLLDVQVKDIDHHIPMEENLIGTHFLDKNKNEYR